MRFDSVGEGTFTGRRAKERTLGIYDRTKKAEPTAKEQARWNELAEAEYERQRKLRKERADTRRGGDQPGTFK